MDGTLLDLRGFVDAAIAVGLGVFIGLEREHSDADGRAHDQDKDAGAPPRPDQIGVRTFALVALLGSLCALLEPSHRGVTLVGFAATCVLVGIQHVRSGKAGGGITTEVAALVAFGLGLLVRQSRLIAVALAVIVTLLLVAKPWVRRVVTSIERRELTATIQLAIMLAVVLPLLPADPMDPWDVLAPRKVGLFVVLIAGISFVGYVLSRVFGARRGAGLSGLVGGLASSTAVTAAMAERARATPAMVLPGQLATFLANAVMFVRVIVVCAVLSRTLALRLAAPMLVMCAVMLAGAFWRWRTLRGKPEGDDHSLALENPFALLPALKWGLLLSIIFVITAVARERFGTSGLLAAAAVSGFADVDAINVAVSRQAGAGALGLGTAVLAITTATMSNTATKAGIALVSGGRAFGGPIALVFAAAMAAGLAASLLG